MTDANKIRILRQALKVAAYRFREPKYGCCWLEAAISCDEALKVTEEEYDNITSE